MRLDRIFGLTVAFLIAIAMSATPSEAWIGDYLNRSCWRMTNPHGELMHNSTVEIFLNTSLYVTDANNFTFGNETDEYGYFNVTPLYLDGRNATVLVQVENIYTTNTSDSKFCIYFNGDDGVYEGDIFETGLKSDDYNDNNISEYIVGSPATGQCSLSKPSVSNGRILSLDVDNACMTIDLDDNTYLPSFMYYTRMKTGNYRGAHMYLSDNYTYGHGAVIGNDQSGNQYDFNTFNSTVNLQARDVANIYPPEWAYVKYGRYHNGSWFGEVNFTTERIILDWSTQNIPDGTYKYFDNITVSVRDQVGFGTAEQDWYSVTRWCDGCEIIFMGAEAREFNVTIISPENTTYKVENIPFEWVNETDIDNAWYNINETGNVSITGNITLNLTDGDYTLVLYANDSTSQISSDSVTFRVDTLIPQIFINQPQNETRNNDSFEFEFTNVNFDCAWYTLDGGANVTNCSVTSPSHIWSGDFGALSEGEHTVVVYANDTADNINWSMVSWTKDTIPPNISILTPQNTTTSSDAFSFEFNDDAVCLWYVVDGGTNVTNCNLVGSTWNGSFTGLSDGEHQVFLYANDSINNAVSVNVSWTRDDSLPDQSISYCLDDNNLFVRVSEKQIINGNITYETTETLEFCNYGCSNITAFGLGEPGCVESDFTVAIILILVILGAAGVLRWIYG